MPTKSDQQAIDYTVEVYKFYLQYRKQIERNAVRDLKTFRAYDDNYELYRRMYRGLGWRSTIYFPVIHANIETLTPRIIMAICGEPDFLDLEAQQQADLEFEDPFKTILTKQWEDMKGFDEASGHVKNNLVYGWSWSKYGWWHDEAIFPVKKPIINLWNARIGSRTKDEKVVLFDGPTITALPVERIYWDPYAKTFNDNKPTDCMCVIDRYFTNKYYVEQRAKQQVWKNTGNIDYGAVQPYQEELETLRKYIFRESQAPAAMIQLNNPWHRQCEIIELYGVNKDGKKRWAYVVANRKHLLFDDRNPFIDPPFLFTRNSQLPGQMIGTSEAEYGRPLNEAINYLRNYHIDNANLGVNGMWKLDRSADIDQNQLISRPWGVVETNNMEGIEPLERPPLTQDAVVEARQLEQDLQTQSGVVDFIKGQPAPGFGGTATAVERLTNAASARFTGRIVHTSINLIQDLFYNMIKLNQLNLSPDMAVRIAGKDGLKFSKFRIDNLKGRFDIRVKTANEQVNKAVQINQILVMYNLFRGDPQIDQRALKHAIISRVTPGLEGRLIMPDTEELSADEENFIMLNGGMVVPLPNENHPEHIRSHMKFIQDHQKELDEMSMRLFMQHIKMHTDIMASVNQPLNAPSPLTPMGGSQNMMAPPGMGGGNGGGLPSGGANGGGGNLADMISAVGGGNVTQSPGQL